MIKLDIAINLIETAINNVITYAQKCFPNETCGFILENGAVYPAHNVIETLNNPTLTAQNGFLIDSETWKAVSIQKFPIMCIFHSHNNGIVDMSEYDCAFLKWKDLYYVIVGLVDHKPVAAKLHWWENDNL